MGPLEVLHIVVCMALFWTCWCRIVKTGESTQPAIRLSFVYGCSSSLVLAGAPWFSAFWPWFPPFEPHPAVLAVLLAVVSFQFSTAKYWRSGPPRHFKRMP